MIKVRGKTFVSIDWSMVAETACVIRKFGSRRKILPIEMLQDLLNNETSTLLHTLLTGSELLKPEEHIPTNNNTGLFFN